MRLICIVNIGLDTRILMGIFQVSLRWHSGLYRKTTKQDCCGMWILWSFFQPEYDCHGSQLPQHWYPERTAKKKMSQYHWKGASDLPQHFLWTLSVRFSTARYRGQASDNNYGWKRLLGFWAKLGCDWYEILAWIMSYLMQPPDGEINLGCHNKITLHIMMFNSCLR